tara:strand:- start:13 stop:141 length:129 start_codon:yes stop_codon:yes gene_type:complete
LRVFFETPKKVSGKDKSGCLEFPVIQKEKYSYGEVMKNGVEK